MLVPAPRARHFSWLLPGRAQIRRKPQNCLGSVGPRFTTLCSSIGSVSIFKGCLTVKGKAMLKIRRHYLWRSSAFAAALLAITCIGGNAKESSSSLKDAEQYV